jgi:hypothetical protein
MRLRLRPNIPGIQWIRIINYLRWHPRVRSLDFLDFEDDDVIDATVNQ